MLWYKSWLETRWRFLIGLALLLCSAAATVFSYPQVMKLMPMVPTNVSGPLGERIREAAELARDYRGYVWSQWFRQNGRQWATLFAILLGTAGILSQSSGALFTLSLPVSRRRLLSIRAATGLSELLLLAFIPSLAISMLSPAIEKSYSIGAALVHSACLFVAASVFFSLAFLLSTFFDDLWPPLLIALAIAVALGVADRILGVYRVMSAETYFRTGHVPWLGLLATAVASAALCYGAVVRIQRRDF